MRNDVNFFFYWRVVFYSFYIFHLINVFCLYFSMTTNGSVIKNLQPAIWGRLSLTVHISVYISTVNPYLWELIRIPYMVVCTPAFKLLIYWVMLRALLSICNYSFYWGRFRKFISFMDSVGYQISYKIVKNTCNIIRFPLGTPGVGLQDGKSFLKGHSNRGAFFLSPRRSDFIIITSPFALRPCLSSF